MNPILVAFLIGAAAVSASQQAKPVTTPAAPGTQQLGLQRAWTAFARAVQRHDLVAIRRLSADCIFMETEVPRPYVSTPRFLKQQWSVVFDINTRARLLRPGCLRYNLENEQNKGLYQRACIVNPTDFKQTKVQEVLVTTIDPYPAGEGEGMQKAFAFIKTRAGYKFCGYSTIP